MSPHEKPDDLARLLRDAVDDIEPSPGIEAIRSRTSLSKESSMTNLRTWFLGGFGAAVATAAVIGGVVLVSNNNPSADNGGPVGDPSVSETVTETPTDDPTSADPTPTGDATGSDDPTTAGRAVPVYYVGDTPRGPRLYREFQRVPDADRLLAAANAAASGDPADPDYRSAWPAGTEFASVSFDGVGVDGLIQVVLQDESLHDRPAAMTEREAELAIEQVIYTLQGAVGARAPVQFRLGQNPIDTVLGVPTSEGLANGPVIDTLSLMNITSPTEGEEVSGTFDVTGVNNGFEGTVACSLRADDRVVWQDAGIGGFGETKLYPWTLTVDTAGIEPGAYTLLCSNDDPSGGVEGAGPFTDDKLIAIR